MTMKMITEKSKCSGCSACQNICPQNAVSMQHRLEGSSPLIDPQKCVECGLCVKVCPFNKNVSQKPETDTGKIYPLVYACRLKDNEILKNSTSGGIFFALAKKVISMGGSVFGAVSGKDFRVTICSADTIAELAAMQGSKYVESNVQFSFQETAAKLIEGRVCLYTALPCQIAGLLSYLSVRKINRENLYTADLVCHGTPSELFYLSYLKNYETSKKITLCQVKHRYKSKKWSSMVPKICAYIDNNGKKDVHASFKDGYLNGFLQGKIYKDNCYECPYASMPRIADFTFADFTGLGAVKKYKNDYKAGVSQLLINSKKGQMLFETVKDDLVFEERGLYEALFFNRNLWKPSRKPKDVDKIRKDFEDGMKWEILRKKYFDKNPKNRMIQFIKDMIPQIFGANLTIKVMFYLKKKKMTPDAALEKINACFNRHTN